MQFVYAKTSHAAAWTDDYVFHQLIPYIGNKRRLLDLIALAFQRTAVQPGATFLDLFAGSGVVSRMAKHVGFRVLANDWEPYAHVINQCAIACNAPPAFKALGGYAAAIEHLNTLEPCVDWITANLCPYDDLAPNPQTERLFYTRANGMRLDAMRQQIAAWEQAGVIDANERACLLAPLVYQACYTSNTSGIFKGFHRGWGGKTGTALYRILAPVRVRPTVFYSNGYANSVFCTDALQLAQELSTTAVDIAYLDPPYNQHPYGSNYHVLNSLTLWDRPAVPPPNTYKMRAAIRDDWRTSRRSAYNHRQLALKAYRDLLAVLNAHFILTSYSTDGLIPLEALLEASIERGATSYVLREYKRYRVSSQRFSSKPLNVEFVVIVDTSRPHRGPSIEAMSAEIRAAERHALSLHPESV